MKLLDNAGFTIIETMLFLGITALLVMGILVGTGSSINIQRYRDSVSSLQSVLQQMYSDVSNVDNDRGSDWVCDSVLSQDNKSIAPEQLDSGTGIARGQSNCVILGRYITTVDSHTLSMKSVVGYIPSIPTSSSNDVEVLKDYKIQISDVTNETYEIEWGSSLMRPGSNNATMFFSMLVLRSPLSGILRTFINPNESVTGDKVYTLIDAATLGQSATICVDSNGLFNTARTAVIITANAASASGVEVLEEASSGC